MKYVFCKKLAAYLCMKPSKSPPPEPPYLYAKSHDVATGHQRNVVSLDFIDSTTPVPTAEDNSVTDLFKEIRDLLKMRVYSAEEQSFEEKKRHRMMKDWKLAAAVVDRICATAFTIIFIAGTLAFIIVITTHPSSSA